ncbi:hypothetical protein ALI144C_44915 [Actinosynnema sp. ALI-1.44]|nr:hypothetical protein ALI144C_44915 [Actinosynnema sp. ALI-1.44]
MENVRAKAARLAELEQLVEKARAERNTALADAKRAGATGDQMAEAAGIDRRNVYPAMRDGGYDPNELRDPQD